MVKKEKKAKKGKKQETQEEAVEETSVQVSESLVEKEVTKDEIPEDIEEEQTQGKRRDDFDPIEPQDLNEKLKIVSSGTDVHSTTFQFNKEDHTLGNALRWAVAKDEEVEYVGYAIPHPSEELLNFRIQTFNGKKTTLDALSDGLDNLIQICDHLTETFKTDFDKGDYTKLLTEQEQLIENISRLKDTHLV